MAKSTFTIFISVFAILLMLATSSFTEEEKSKDKKTPTQVEYIEKANRRIKTFKHPEGLKVELWADTSQTVNPSSFIFGPNGEMYMCEINRWRFGVDDIRDRQYMFLEDLSIQSSADRLRMFKNHLDKHPMKWYTDKEDLIRVLKDTNGDGRADSTTIYADSFNDPLDGPGIGVIERDGKVYYTNIPHLWMLEDKDGDGKSDKRTSLQEGFGIRMSFSGHDMHGLVWGPDGKLYFSVGDRGYSLKTKEGKHLHGPNKGAVFRCDPDGSNMELFYDSLRNPQELAFDDYGNLFTGDNDGDGGDKERINYIVEGGESGWTAGHQAIMSFSRQCNFRSFGYKDKKKVPCSWLVEDMWKPRQVHQPAWILPGIAQCFDGPTGLVYNPANSLGEAYNDHFFLVHYKGSAAHSFISSFKVKDDGATFKVVKNDSFIRGSNFVDVEFGPDGRLYISEYNYGGWVNENVGNVYALSFPNELKKPEVAENKEILTSDFTKKKVDELVTLLERDHLYIRQKAQFELAKRGAEGLEAFRLAAVNIKNSTLKRIHGVWGLGQMASRNKNILKPLLRLLSDKDVQVRIQSARVLGDNRLMEAKAHLISSLKDENNRVAMYAAIGLGRMGCNSALPTLIDVLKKNNDRDLWLRHGVVMALYGMTNKKAYMAEIENESVAVRMAILLCLRKHQDPAIAAFLNDSNQRLVDEAIRAINDLPIHAATVRLAAHLDNYLPGKDKPLPQGKIAEFLHHRMINANFYSAQKTDAKRLLAYAANNKLSENLRREALAALEAWNDKHPLDNTTGLPRALAMGRENIKEVVLDNIKPVLDNSQGKVLAQATRLAAKNGYHFPSEILLAYLVDEKSSLAVQQEALKSLTSRKEKALVDKLPYLLEHKNAQMRALALEALIQLLPERGVATAINFVNTRKTKDKQAALRLIAIHPSKSVVTLLKKELEAIMEGKGNKSIMLEVLTACRGRQEEEIKQLVVQFDAAQKSDILKEFQECVEGGDVAKGKDVFFNFGAAQCMRCHKIDGKGADVGPDLSDIGKMHNKTYLLQSIVDPAAVVAPGFGLVTITLKDGALVSATYLKEKDGEVHVKVENKIKVYKKADIKEMSSPVSGMPPMRFLLNKEQIRDLVAYMATLKKEVGAATSH